MDYKIYAVRIGEKYGLDHEARLKKQLDINWIRDEEDGVALQWNKLRAFQGEDCPVVLIDIDLEFINDYKKLFELPVERGEFLTTKNWYGQDNPTAIHYKIAGGFYKFWPEDTKYILDAFRKDKQYWQNHYIDQGITCGPVNGEMNFVEDCVRGRVGTTALKMKFVPDAWHTKWKYKPEEGYIYRLTKRYDNDWLWMGEFHSDIKLVHYQMESSRNNKD